MRFFNLSGELAKARRYVASAASVQEEEVKSPSKLAEILRLLMARVSKLEAVTAPEPVEFETEVPSAGSTVSLAHNLNSQVRFSIVFWTKVQAGAAYPTAAPVLIADETSTNDVLVLRSYVAGRAVVRIEPAFSGLAYNVS